MMLSDSYPISISFSQRMSFLEKIAFYRPLTYILPKSNEVDCQNHFLACDCKEFECDHQSEMFYQEIRGAVKIARSLILQEIQDNPYAENVSDKRHLKIQCVLSVIPLTYFS